MIDLSDNDSELEQSTDSSREASNSPQPVPPSPNTSRLAPQRSYDSQSVHSSHSAYELNVNPHRDWSRSPRGSPLPYQPYSDSGPTNDSEEEEHRSLLQLYVLVARCIAYPFAHKQNADKVPTHGVRTTEQSLREMRDRFEAFLEGRTRLSGNVDAAVQEAMRIYNETVLVNADVAALVRAGGWMVEDFALVFRAMLPRMLADLELDEETDARVKSVWLQIFGVLSRGEPGLAYQDASSSSLNITPASSEMLLTTEQLYEVFQGVLGVKRFEHQILFNQCQLGSRDEQASLLRRELQLRGEVSQTLQPDSMGQLFVRPEMAIMYMKEEQGAVRKLLHLLDSVPVNNNSFRVGTLGRVIKSPRTLSRHTHVDSSATKSDIVIPLTVEVIIMEARGLDTVKHVSPTSIVYATMKVDGSQEKMMTNKMEAEHPQWEIQGDFATTIPRPHVRIDVFMEDNSYTSLSGEKRIGKISLQPTSAQPVPLAWYKLESSDSKDVEVKVQVKMDRPDAMKKFGSVQVKGTHCWKKLKCRYLILVQITQRLFALCSYEERQRSPKKMIIVDGYTVDYCEPQYLGGDECGDKYSYQFVAEKEGDEILFGCQEEHDRQSWVMALCRATGQQHRPEPIRKQSHEIGGSNVHTQSVTKRIGLDDFLQTDVSTFDHSALFARLQAMTLSYRLCERSCNLGWFSPGQTFVLDEYCSRYGVRQAKRYLCWLQQQLNRVFQGNVIDPGLMHYCYTWIEAHLRGMKPDSATGSILLEEKQWFENLQGDLRVVLLRNLRNFRSFFPFGRPANALKFTLSLLERMIVTDSTNEDMLESLHSEIRSCMRTAALKCYNSISAQAQQKMGAWIVQEQAEISNGDDYDGRRESVLQVNVDVQGVDYIVTLAQLGIELCQEIEDFHGASFQRFKDSLRCCIETVWELFYSDMSTAVAAQPRYNWDVFRLFYRLNEFLSSHTILRNGSFYKQLLELFMPKVIDYISHVEMEVTAHLKEDLSNEKWDPEGQVSVNALQNMLQELENLQLFTSKLQWPDQDFCKHLELRVGRLAADAMESFAKRTQTLFNACCRKDGGSGNGLHFVIAAEPCVMLNVICTLEHKVQDFCPLSSDSSQQMVYRADIGNVLNQIKDNMTAKLIIRLTANLEDLLSQLARHDVGWVPSFFRSLAAPKLEIIKPFVQYVSRNLTEVDRLLFVDRQQFMLAWHNVMCKKMLDFVNKRAGALAKQQMTFISTLMEQQLQCFSEYGFSEQELKSQFYTMVHDRIRYEVSAGDLLGERKESESW